MGIAIINLGWVCIILAFFRTAAVFVRSMFLLLSWKQREISLEHYTTKQKIIDRQFYYARVFTFLGWGIMLAGVLISL